MNEESKKQIYNEASIMKKLFHPNVILFKEVIIDKKLDYFYIIMEYADDGDLSKKIKQQKNKKTSEKYFPEETIVKYFYQICQGINYIHSKNVIHRDIKSQNIFLNKNGSIKIGDFGIAKALSKTNSNAMTVIGTPYYFSPEIINGEPYNYKTDIWSLGVVLYELCTLKLPFDSNNIAQLSMKILRGNYDPIPFKYSKEMHSIIKKMLNVDQNKRPDIKEVLQCPLLKNISPNINLNNTNFNKNKKNLNNRNQKSVIINSTATNLNIKMNEAFMDQKKKEIKSLVNKKENKDKSCSPYKFKNKSFIGKAGFIKKTNENSESSIDLPKASEKEKSKKSGVFKRNVSQKMISVKSQSKEEKEENKVNNKENNSLIKNNKSINNSINGFSNKNINNINNKKMYNNGIINTDINNIIINENNKANIYNENYSNNPINNKSNNNIGNNLFYNVNLNKDEIINRSNAFDANFSGKSILFDKEKTINFKNDDENNKNNNINNINKNNYPSSNDNMNFNKNNFNKVYNFNEQTIKMFTLKEEDEENLKSNNDFSNNELYNGDIENLNFIIQNNTNRIKEEKNQNDCVNYFTKEYNNESDIKVDLDFEIINNSMNNDNHEEERKNEEKVNEKNTKKQFVLNEYIKSKIGEKMYSIIKEYLVNANIEQIVNFRSDKFINKLHDVLLEKKFREREIKNAEKYIFDIFFDIIKI